MGRYLMIWELDAAKIPIDPKERADGWAFLMAMVKQDMEKGITKDWGAFVGGVDGYCIVEGPEVEVQKTIQQYVPFCFFKTYPLLSMSDADEIVKSLSG